MLYWPVEQVFYSHLKLNLITIRIMFLGIP